MEYRKRLTGEVFTYQQLLQAVTNVYIPPMPTEAYMDALGYDIIQEVVPEQLTYTEVRRFGIEQKEDGKWYQVWRAIPWPQDMIEAEELRLAQVLVSEKLALMVKIDDAVADRIERSTRFTLEYQQREAAAQAYKDAGYQGDESPWIARFATNKKMPYEVAVDLVLQQAEGLRNVLLQLGNLRMDKYLVEDAETFEDANQIAEGILSQVKAIIIP